MPTVRRLSLPAVLPCLLGCSDAAAVRPQLVVVVDTDLPVFALVDADQKLSRAAAVDTVRIDVLRDDGSVQDTRTIVAPDRSDWPISFGVAREPGTEHVMLRVQVFRGEWASRRALGSTTVLEPFPEVAVDRVLVAPLPLQGTDTILVMLAGDCRGLVSDFVRGTTCIDAQRREAPFTDGLERLGPHAKPRTRSGSWPGAREVGCEIAPDEGQVCVPGGFTVMGDPGLAGIPSVKSQPIPLQPAILSPFLMDRTEMTVGRYRRLLREGLVKEEPQSAVANDFVLSGCTWVGSSSSKNDALPLSCATYPLARAACEAVGGSLPTEAQFEHAARGRGLGVAFPWGDELPTCCTASLSHAKEIGGDALCPPHGPWPAGSHADPDACNGIADVTRDGVLDLGGSLREIMLDRFRPYGRCLPRGVLVDPVCSDESSKLYVTRGGDYSSGFNTARSSWRSWSVGNVGSIGGFRCVYPAVVQ